MGYLFQFIGTAILCTVSIDMGIIFTWPASTISLFSSENTPLNRPMTPTEISLLGSLSSIGSIISTLFSGYLLNKLGRKKCCIVISLFMIIFWLIVTFSRQVEVILTGVFLSGVSSAVILTCGVFITEICQDSIRGSMTGGNMVSYGLGMLISYCIGGYLSYETVLYVGLAQSVLRTCLLFILKESPMFLMQNDKEREAAKSIAFYRNLETSDSEVLEELDVLRRALDPDLTVSDSTSETELLQGESQTVVKPTFLQFMKRSKSSQRAFILALVLITASTLQGLIILQMYIKVLFEKEIPSISPTSGGVIMAAITVIAGIVASAMTDIAGRRFLMIYGSLASGIVCALTGLQLQLHFGPSWVTAFLIFMFTITYTLGAGTVPFIVFAEIFLPEIKSIIIIIVIEWAWVCNFIILFVSNPLLTALGWGPMFYCFAVISFITVIYSLIYLPETQGLSVNEIQRLFQ